MNDIISTHQLSRRFGDITGVNALSLSIAPGELFGLVGSDGAGKTTTLRMLAGVLDPTSGDVHVLGHPMPGDAEKIRGEIGYMSQRFGLYTDLTVDENLRFYAELFELSKKERQQRTEELLSFSRLTEFRSRRAGNLSGGMKQKLGLACALIHTPKLLLLDEPTNGVDPVSRRDFWRILHSLLKQGVTIIVTTAYLDEAERCSRVGLIHEGRLLACDTPAALKKPLEERVLEILTAAPRPALHRLREHLPDHSFALFGDRIHCVLTSATRQAVSTILPDAAVRIVEPTLEDVLVHALEAERAA